MFFYDIIIKSKIVKYVMLVKYFIFKNDYFCNLFKILYCLNVMCILLYFYFLYYCLFIIVFF